MKWLLKGFLSLAVIVILIQFIRPEMTNPPVTGDIKAPPAVAELLRRSCYDCHSNETHWPWYAQVAPISWLVARDVNDARKHLNFSIWEGYSSDRKSKKLGEIEEEVSAGEMPIAIYVSLHAQAQLSEAEKTILTTWAKSP